MGLFSRKKIELKTEEEKKEIVNQSFSGYRLEIPSDSNLPVIFNNYGINGMVPFGYDGSSMTFPLIVEQSIYESAPSHANCIKLAVLSTIGGGFDFGDDSNKTLLERKDIEVFKKSFGTNFRTFLRAITQDFRLHNRINIKVVKKSNGMLFYERISPSKIGYNKDKTKYYYSEDFMTYNYNKIYDKYEEGCIPGEYMLDFDGVVDKYEPYPAPEWISGFKHININSKIPGFHEANMENSINPTLIIKRPVEFKTMAEKTKWFKDLFSRKGEKQTGTTMLFSANSIEQLPIVEQLSANDNDKLFEVLRNSTIDDICMAHNINPVLIGVKTPGSLGANQEMEIAWELFYNIVVLDMREHIIDTIENLLSYSDIVSEFNLIEKRPFTKMSGEKDTFTIKKD